MELLTVQTRPETPHPDRPLIYRSSYIFGRQSAIERHAIPERSILDAARMLQIQCPHNCAGPGVWCQGPSGRTLHVMHVARWDRAVEEGWWGARELPIPDIRGTVR